MKKILLALPMFLLAVSLMAGQNPPLNQTANPDHAYDHNFQVNDGVGRSLVYLQTSYRHDTYSTGTSAWSMSDSGQFTYNANGKPTNNLYLGYINPGWGYTTQYNFTYTGQGDLQQQTLQTYNAGHTWDNTTRYTNTYDGNRNALQELTENWVNGNWRNLSRNVHSVNANGDDTLTLQDAWDTVGSTWKTNYKTFTAYHNHLQDSSIQQYDNAGTWTNLTKFIYTYNGNGKVLTTIYQTWQSNTWVNVTLTTNTYNGQGKISNVTQQHWNGNSLTWVDQSKTDYTFDGSGNETEWKDYYWDSNNSQWIPLHDYTFSYDGNNNMTYELHQSYNPVGSYFYNTNRYYYYYTQQNVTGINEVQNELSASIFPNPSSNGASTLSFTTVENTTATIAVFDVEGRILSLERRAINAGENHIAIQLNNAETGLYFVRLTDLTSGKTSTLKLIKGN